MSLKDTGVAVVRTGVAALAGYGVGLLAKYGFHVNSAVADATLQGVVTPLYYAAVAYAESYYAKAGWLLGVRKAVAYVEQHDTPAAPPAK